MLPDQTRPEQNQPRPEATPQPGAEQLSATEAGADAAEPVPAGENAPTGNHNAGQPAVSPVATPADQSAPAATQPSATSTPPAAADAEVIEKPWVEKAEHIIEQTKADPQAEEAAEEQLNRDYLKQRFNFDVRDSD